MAFVLRAIGSANGSVIGFGGFSAHTLNAWPSSGSAGIWRKLASIVAGCSCVVAMAQSNVYFMGTGAGTKDGTSPANAYAFSHDRIRDRLNQTADTNGVVVHLLSVGGAPTVYNIQPLPMSGGNPGLVKLVGETNNPHLVTLRLNTNAADETLGFDNAEEFVLHTYDGVMLEKFEVEDLTLDANFSNQGESASAVLGHSYKNGGLKVSCVQGRISRVVVKNFGANGFVPVSRFNPSGSEAFPLFIQTLNADQGNYPGEAAPVVVRDCEVSGFTSLHGGYCTAIGVRTYPIEGSLNNWVEFGSSDCGASMPRFDASGTNRQYRPIGCRYLTNALALITGCQVRGTNLVIGFGAGGSEAILMTNNVAINCTLGVNADTGELRRFSFNSNVVLDVSSGLSVGGPGWGEAGYSDISIKNNSFRMGGRKTQSLYSDFCYSSDGVGGFTSASNAELELGRSVTNYSAVLWIMGGTSAVDFQNNAVTTRDLTHFFPGSGAAASFRAVWNQLPWLLDMGCGGPLYITSQEFNPIGTRTGNKLSGYAWDFRSTWSDLPTTADTSDRSPLSADSNIPALAGTLGRVQVSAGSVRELLLASLADTNGTVTVRARLADQPSGSVVTNVVVQFMVTDASGSAYASGSASTTNTGWAVWTYSRQTAGRDLVQAWVDQSPGTTSVLDDSIDIHGWIQADWGSVVTITSSPDTCDDKLTNRVSRLTLSRTGSTSDALTVTCAINTNGLRAATYTTDYSLYSSNTLSSSATSFAVTIPAGASSSTVEVRPAYDGSSILEMEGVWVQLASLSTNTVKIAGDTNSTVYIFDGPKYTVIELPLYGSPTYAYALDDQATPNLAGLTGGKGTWWYTNGSGVYTYSWLNVPMYYNSLTPYGVATGNDGKIFVGTALYYDNTTLKAFRYSGTSATILGNLGGSGTTEALAVSPNTNYIVGYSPNANGYQRAARWRGNNTWNPEDLGSLAGVNTARSYAYAVNSGGKVVGKSAMASGGTVYHAFRTAGGNAMIGGGDELVGLDTVSGTSSTRNCQANAINVGGDAVGRSEQAGSSDYRAVFWPDGSSVSSDLGVLAGGNRSEAWSINDHGQIVGTSRTTTSSGSEHAFLMSWSGGDMIDLHDKDLTAKGSGWTLVSAEAINNAGYIIGWGYKDGSTKAFILVPNH